MDLSSDYRHDWKRIEKRCRLQKIEQYNTRNWMRIHGKIHELGRKQRYDLKHLFNQLDSDSTGVISIEELYEPLLSLGIVSSKQEVEKLVQYVSAKKGGVIQFEEFVKIFDVEKQPHLRKKGVMDKLVKTVAGNMKEFQKNDLPFNVSVSNRRRALMMQAYVSENALDKEKGMKVISAFASEVNSCVSPSKNQRIYNRRKSEFKETRPGDSPQKLTPIQKSDKIFLDSFMRYLPPDNLKVRSMNKVSRINFMKSFNS